MASVVNQRVFFFAFSGFAGTAMGNLKKQGCWVAIDAKCAYLELVDRTSRKMKNREKNIEDDLPGFPDCWVRDPRNSPSVTTISQMAILRQ